MKIDKEVLEEIYDLVSRVLGLSKKDSTLYYRVEEEYPFVVVEVFLDHPWKFSVTTALLKDYYLVSYPDEKYLNWYQLPPQYLRTLSLYDYYTKQSVEYCHGADTIRTNNDNPVILYQFIPPEKDFPNEIKHLIALKLASKLCAEYTGNHDRKKILEDLYKNYLHLDIIADNRKN